MRISGHVRSTFNPDGVVLMDIQGGNIFNLNPSGSVIWQQIAKGSPIDEIAQIVSKRFDISFEQALKDVKELIEQLRTHNLICTCESQDRESRSKGRFGF